MVSSDKLAEDSIIYSFGIGNEVVDAITGCPHFFFVESFDKGIKELSQKIGISLKPMYIRKAPVVVDIKDSEMECLKKLIEPEMRLLEKLKNA